MCADGVLCLSLFCPPATWMTLMLTFSVDKLRSRGFGDLTVCAWVCVGRTLAFGKGWLFISVEV